MKLADLGIGSQSPSPVAEYEAEGEIERVYHEIRQSLRVTGVNLLFRTWAGLGKFLPAVWEELRPNVQTIALDRGTDELRDEAVRAANSLPHAEAPDPQGLGESRAFQIRAALDLYHYINPKLLVLVAAVRQALQSESVVSPSPGRVEPAPRGEPAKMYPMEMESEEIDDKALRRLFKDIRKTLSLSSINSDYRTLALWPDYLAAAWDRLKPVCQSPEFAEAADQLRQKARAMARQLPYHMALSLGRIKELGADPDQVLQVTQKFEQLLPGLILNIAILHQEWQPHQAQPAVAEPAGSSRITEVPEPAWRAFQKRQRVLELDDQFVSYLDEGVGEPVVLLHGIPTWGFLWERVIAGLSPRYRVLVPDLLGYGYSSKRDDFDRSLARQTGMLTAFLSRLELPSAHLVGHDLGGGIALRLATLFPERARSLSLLNSVCYDSWPVEMMLQLGHPTAARTLSPAKALKALAKGIQVGFNHAPDAEWLEGLLSPWRTEVGRLSLMRNAVALNTNHTTEITRLLPGIRIPTLVLWGENDTLQPVKYAQRLAQDIPGANLVRIIEARHFVMIDQPERVQRALEQFLDQQAVPAARAAA